MSDPTTYGGIAVRGLTLEKILRKLAANTYNVKNFGAKGDGTTDDTTAIQAAIDAAETVGGTVFLPPGTYVVSSITIDTNGTSMVGASLQDTILDHKTGSGNSNLLVVDCANVLLSRFRLTGLGASSGTAAGIYADATGLTTTTMGRIRLRDIQISDFGGDGVYMYKPELSELREVFVSDCGGVGIHLKADGSGRGINNVLENCRAISCDGAAQIYLEAQMTGCSLIDVEALQGTASNQCIRINGTGHTLIGCDAESGAAHGFYASGSGHTFLGCYANSVTYGITLSSAVDIVIGGLRATPSVTRCLWVDSNSAAVLLSLVDGSTSGVLNQGALQGFDNSGNLYTATFGAGQYINMPNTGNGEPIFSCEPTGDSVTADPTTDAPAGWMAITVSATVTALRYIPYYTVDGA